MASKRLSAADTLITMSGNYPVPCVKNRGGANLFPFISTPSYMKSNGTLPGGANWMK